VWCCLTSSQAFLLDLVIASKRLLASQTLSCFLAYCAIRSCVVQAAPVLVLFFVLLSAIWKKARKPLNGFVTFELDRGSRRCSNSTRRSDRKWPNRPSSGSRERGSRCSGKKRNLPWRTGNCTWVQSSCLLTWQIWVPGRNAKSYREKANGDVCDRLWQIRFVKESTGVVLTPSLLTSHVVTSSFHTSPILTSPVTTSPVTTSPVTTSPVPSSPVLSLHAFNHI